jgi:hypothetical protein
LLTATQVTYSGRLGPPTFVVPALAFLSGVRQRPRSSAATLAWVGFGDPALGASPAAPGAAEIAADVVRPAELVPLPGTRRELERARRLIGGPSRLYLGAAATEEAVRSLPPSRVLHFASHGLIDHRSPTSSSIVLSTEGGGDGEREHDGFLQAWEVIESLDLDSDLVVLSACNTGLGPLAGSEGLLGLSRAFLLAGSRSLLVSLWPLSDQASSLFMEHFYDALLDGVGKDEALRRAQAAVRATEEFRHPYYWAAFELIGDPSPLTGIERRRFAAAVPLSVAVLVALSVALVLIRGIVSRRSWARTRGAGRPI